MPVKFHSNIGADQQAEVLAVLALPQACSPHICGMIHETGPFPAKQTSAVGCGHCARGMDIGHDATAPVAMSTAAMLQHG